MSKLSESQGLKGCHEIAGMHHLTLKAHFRFKNFAFIEVNCSTKQSNVNVNVNKNYRTMKARRNPLILILIITAIVILAMSYSFSIGKKIATRYLPLVDAVLQVKLEATLSHLRLEESISGRRVVDIKEVLEHLDRSERSARVMLEGGQNLEGTLTNSLKDPVLRQKVKQTIDHIVAFQAVTQKRWEEHSNVSVGSNIGQRFDEASGNLFALADEVEEELHLIIKRQLLRFHQTQLLIVFIVGILGLLVGWRFLHYEKIRMTKLRGTQAKESYSRKIFDEAPLGVAVIDSHTGAIHEVNQRFAQIAGRTREEMITMDWMHITHPDDVQEDLDNMALLNAGKIPSFTMEKRYRQPGGSYVWIKMTVAPMSANKDEPAYHLCMIDDITERKTMQEELLRFDRSLESLVQVNQTIIQAQSEQALLQDVCRDIVETGGYDSAWIGYAEHDDKKTIRLMAHAGLAKKYINSFDMSWADNPTGRGPAGIAIRNNKITITDNTLTNLGFEEWHAHAIKYGFNSSIAIPIVIGENSIGVISVYSSRATETFDCNEVQLLQEMADDIAFGIKNQRVTVSREDYAEQLSQSLKQTIEAIALTVEIRDPYTAGHMNRVAELSVAIAKEIGLSENQIKGIEFGARIHDLGKISVPGEILNRPGKLMASEFDLIKNHVQAGYDIVKGIDFPWPVAEMVVQHHERLDGSGYPNGLKGDEITLEAKVLAVADVVEAISSHRPYRAAQSIEVGLEVITANKGTHYSPEIVDACVKLIKEDGFEFSSLFG